MLDAQHHLVLFFTDAPGVRLQLVDPDPNVPDKLVGGHPSQLRNDSGCWNVKPGGHARVMNASKTAVKIGVCQIRFDNPADPAEPVDGDATLIEPSPPASLKTRLDHSMSAFANPPAKDPPPSPPLDEDSDADGNAGSLRTPPHSGPPPRPPPVDEESEEDDDTGSPRTPPAEVPPPSPPLDENAEGDGNAGSPA